LLVQTFCVLYQVSENGIKYALHLLFTNCLFIKPLTAFPLASFTYHQKRGVAILQPRGQPRSKLLMGERRLRGNSFDFITGVKSLKFPSAAFTRFVKYCGRSPTHGLHFAQDEPASLLHTRICLQAWKCFIFKISCVFDILRQFV